MVCVQNSYGLGHHPEQDDFVGVCGERGIAYVPFFPLGGFGLPDDERIGRVADRHEATVAQVILAWLLASALGWWRERASQLSGG